MPTLEELAASEPQDKLAELAANEPPPPAPQAPAEPSIWQKFLKLSNPPGHGRAGGIVGGLVGSFAGGLPGTIAGATIGDAIGQRLQIGKEGLSPEQQAQLDKGTLPYDYVPARPPPGVDIGAAVTDGATQGVVGGALKLAGGAAARLGFPRVAGVLGSKTPQAAALGATPEAVQAVSTPALQSVDAAGTLSSAAAKEQAALLADQARRDAVLAIERGTAEKTMAPIQQRMGQRVPGLAQKTKGFVDELRQAVPPEKLDKAFEDAPSVAEAASNPTVMQARQGMIQEAVPQTVDNQALKMARRPVAAAEARGVTPQSGGQAAADAAGLRELGGAVSPAESYATRTVNKIPGMGTAAQVLPKGGLAVTDRVPQAAAAVLQSRGVPTVNPALAKMLSDSAAYRASPTTQLSTEALRAFLDKIGNKQ